MLSADSGKNFGILKWLVVAVAAAAIAFSAFRLPTVNIGVPVLFLALAIINVATHINIPRFKLKAQISLTGVLLNVTILLFGTRHAVLVAALVSLCLLLRQKENIRNLFLDVATIPLRTFLIGWSLYMTLGPVNGRRANLIEAVAILGIIGIVSSVVSFVAEAVGNFEQSDIPVWRTYGENHSWLLAGNFLAAALAVTIAYVSTLIGFYPTLVSITAAAVAYWVYCLSAQAKSA